MKQAQNSDSETPVKKACKLSMHKFFWGVKIIGVFVSNLETVDDTSKSIKLPNCSDHFRARSFYALLLKVENKRDKMTKM